MCAPGYNLVVIGGSDGVEAYPAHRTVQFGTIQFLYELARCRDY